MTRVTAALAALSCCAIAACTGPPEKQARLSAVDIRALR